MAFVSINDIKKNNGEDKRLASPTLTINSRGVGHITRAVYGDIKPSTIDVELDLEMGMVRLKTGDNLSKKLIGRIKHSFGVPIAVRRKLLAEGEQKLTIALTKSEDGWWYGSYQAGKGEGEGKA